MASPLGSEGHSIHNLSCACLRVFVLFFLIIITVVPTKNPLLQSHKKPVINMANCSVLELNPVCNTAARTNYHQ